MSFIKKIEVLASPQNVDWTGFKPKEMNAAMYSQIAKDTRKKKIATLDDGIYLYELPDKFVALNTHKHKVVYLVQYSKKVIFGKQGITQVKVWRDKASSVTDGLAKKIFFTHLFPLADCIVSDRQQTSYGRAFWELRIYEAFSRGHHVYLLDQNKQTQTLLQTTDDFDDLADTWWGDTLQYQGRKIAICHTKLW